MTFRQWIWRVSGAKAVIDDLYENNAQVATAAASLRLRNAELAKMVLDRGRERDQLLANVETLARSGAQATYDLQLAARDNEVAVASLQAELEIAVGCLTDDGFAQYSQLKNAQRPDRDPTAWARKVMGELKEETGQ